MKLTPRSTAFLPATLMLLLVIYTTACGGTQEPSSTPTAAESQTKTQASPTPIAAAPQTETQSSPTPKASASQTEIQTTPTPTATAQPVAPPTPTAFATSTNYDIFPDGLPATFKAAVELEFAAAPEKAGISVAVYTDNTLWTFASGKADGTITMTTNTPLLISSTSKTFLSAMILKQLEDGHYKLTDSLGAVLADHPDFQSFSLDKINPEVTIEELLTMSSGLPNFNDNRQGIGKMFSQPSYKPSDLINLVQSKFVAPGTYEYNDTNVVLLGLIAELYGGQGLADLYREILYDPLGITGMTLPEEGLPWHPEVFDDQGDDVTVPKIAMPHGVYKNPSGVDSAWGNIVQSAPWSFGYYLAGQGRIRYACCGIVSTPENMARWAYELYSSNGSAISESTRTDLLNSVSATRVPPWNGPRTPTEEYGYFISKKLFLLPSDREITAYGHRGGGGGYSAWMHYSPDLDLSISILANSDLKSTGTCRVENLGNCIALSIFDSYSSNQ